VCGLSPAQAGGHADGLVLGERPLATDPLGEGLPLHELHHDVVQVAIRTRVEHRDEVRMRETRRRLRLASEALDERSVPAEVVR
jgi:hypothetical protein